MKKSWASRLSDQPAATNGFVMMEHPLFSLAEDQGYHKHGAAIEVRRHDGKESGIPERTNLCTADEEIICP
jgi:hypothetical protein